MHPVLRPPARRHDPACAKACPSRSIQFGPIDVLEACDESARGPQVYDAMARDRLRAIGHSMGAATLLAITSSADDLSAAHILRFILMWLLVLNALVVLRILGRVDMAGHLSDLGTHTTTLRVGLHYTV